ncbi:HEAT repeat domain-containing protein [Halovulum sp. GXIMD14794]
MTGAADIEAALLALDAKTWGDVETAREALLPLGPAIFPAALQVYPRLRGFKARTALVYTAMKFAQVEPDAVTLALSALEDRSAPVRYRACMLLSVAGRRDTLPALRTLLHHPKDETRADAGAAIRAIERGNPHLFVDRTGSGRVHLHIGGLVRPD